MAGLPGALVMDDRRPAGQMDNPHRIEPHPAAY
jgi:hypothetical protein